METVSLLIRNVRVYNTYLKKFLDADVFVKEDRFYYIDRGRAEGMAAGRIIEGDTTADRFIGEDRMTADRVIDADGMYMLPGLIDVHMHVESSMMTPGPFGRFLASCGVTTVVSEPHEIANVEGLGGILEMIRAGEETPIDILYGIPSSVPSTRPELETTGGSILLEDMKHLLEEKDVVCVGEIMNFRQIIRENDLEISKFLDYLREERPNWVIEGHCPSLVGPDLAKFLYLGIDGDHTEHTLEEVRQRIENGMFMELQDKMLREEILDYIKENRLYEYCCFVTDDTMADVLYSEGQLNRVIEKAVERGFPLEMALYCGTYTPSRRMRLYDRGVIAPGKLADFMLVKDPAKLRPELVFKNGVEIFRRSKEDAAGSCRAEQLPGTEFRGERELPDIAGELEKESVSLHEFPEEYYRSVRLAPLSIRDFEMPLSRFYRGNTAEVSEVTVRAIEVLPDRTQTREKLVTMPVRDGKICWEGSGCLLAMTLERHGKNGSVGYGFLTGSCHTRGTVATTYFHDHHNLFVAGSSIEDMFLAVRRIEKLQGGFLTVCDGRISEELPLPVCGLLSEDSVEGVGTKLSRVRESLHSLGYRHTNAIMSVATLGLPVSPALKLTDRGLVDVKKSAPVDLVTEVH